MDTTTTGTPLPDYAPQDTIQQFSLDGKVAIVTGASRGLGEVLAESLAGAGADVAIFGREQKTLDEVAQRLQDQTGRKIFPYVADVGQFETIAPSVEAVHQEFGH